MNFYKRHLGDIAKACAHLSQGQIGAYDLLLDWIYGNERPLPLDKAALHRIGRASTKAERDNVDQVIAEFFVRTPDGYTQKRAEAELAAWRVQAETNRRIAVEREAKKRAKKPARTEHEACYESSEKRDTNGQPSQNPESITASSNFCAQPEIPTPGPAPEPPKPAEPPMTATRSEAGRACLLMRMAGCVTVNPSHPDLLAAIAAGVTPEALGDAAREAVELRKSKPFPWAIATARGRLEESNRKPTTGARRHDPQPVLSLADKAARRAAQILAQHYPDEPAGQGPDEDLAHGRGRLGAPLDLAAG